MKFALHVPHSSLPLLLNLWLQSVSVVVADDVCGRMGRNSNDFDDRISRPMTKATAAARNLRISKIISDTATSLVELPYFTYLLDHFSDLTLLSLTPEI